MVVCEDQGTAKIEFAANEAGCTNLGWITVLSPVASQLWKAREAVPNVCLVAGSSVTSINLRISEVTVRLDAESENIRRRLWIAADGAQSSVGKILSLKPARTATSHSYLMLCTIKCA